MSTKVMTTLGRWIGIVAGVIWTWPARRCGWAMRSLFRGQPQGAVKSTAQTAPDWAMVAVDAHRIGEQAAGMTQHNTVIIDRVIYVDSGSLISALVRTISAALRSREFSMLAIVAAVMSSAFAVFSMR